jgi:hypothetical protein
VKQAVGYRVWRPDGGKLVSPFFPTAWPQSTRLEAVCLDEPASFLPGHRPIAHQREPTAPPPVANCGCGIYAYHDVARMLGAIHPPLIGGAVLCWGRITIHPEGIRAQFARPIALCFPEPWLRADRTQSPLTGVAAGYRIPLLESSYLVSYAGEFGESYLPPKMPAGSAWFGTATRRFFSWLTGV